MANIESGGGMARRQHARRGRRPEKAQSPASQAKPIAAAELSAAGGCARIGGEIGVIGLLCGVRRAIFWRRAAGAGAKAVALLLC